MEGATWGRGESKAGLQVLVAQVVGQCSQEVQGGQRGASSYTPSSLRTHLQAPARAPCTPSLASGPTGSASAHQTTADAELGARAPGQSMEASMRTRMLTSDAQTVPTGAAPFCCLPCGGEPRRRGTQVSGQIQDLDNEGAQSCPTLCDPMDCSPPGSSVHGILQARIVDWVTISFSRGSSQPRDQTQVSCTAGRHFTV